MPDCLVEKGRCLLFPAPSAKGYAMPREMPSLVPCRGKKNFFRHEDLPNVRLSCCKWLYLYHPLPTIIIPYPVHVKWLDWSHAGAKLNQLIRSAHQPTNQLVLMIVCSLNCQANVGFSNSKKVWSDYVTMRSAHYDLSPPIQETEHFVRSTARWRCVAHFDSLPSLSRRSPDFPAKGRIPTRWLEMAHQLEAELFLSILNMFIAAECVEVLSLKSFGATFG